MAFTPKVNPYTGKLQLVFDESGGISSNVSEFIPIEWAEEGTSSPGIATPVQNSSGVIHVRNFDDASVEDLIIPWVVPSNLDVNEDITFQVGCVVTNSTGPSNEGVSFKLSGYSVGTGDDIDGTYGTEVESKKTAMTYAQHVNFLTDESSAITITNLAVGELVMLHFERSEIKELVMEATAILPARLDRRGRGEKSKKI